MHLFMFGKHLWGAHDGMWEAPLPALPNRGVGRGSQLMPHYKPAYPEARLSWSGGVPHLPFSLPLLFPSFPSCDRDGTGWNVTARKGRWRHGMWRNNTEWGWRHGMGLDDTEWDVTARIVMLHITKGEVTARNGGDGNGDDDTEWDVTARNATATG